MRHFPDSSNKNAVSAPVLSLIKLQRYIRHSRKLSLTFPFPSVSLSTISATFAHSYVPLKLYHSIFEYGFFCISNRFSYLVILINPLLYNRVSAPTQTSYLQLPCLYPLPAVHIAESFGVLPLIFQTALFVKVRLPCVLSVIL